MFNNFFAKYKMPQTEEQKQKKKEYMKDYYERNKEQKKDYYEKNNEKKKDYYEKNKEKKKEYMKAYREKNKDKTKDYYERTKEKQKQYQKDYYERTKDKKKDYYKKNKEIIKEQTKEYRQTPEGKKVYIISCWKVRGLKETKEKINELYEIYTAIKFCEACDVELTRTGKCCSTDICLDHCHTTGKFRLMLCRTCNNQDNWKKYFC